MLNPFVTCGEKKKHFCVTLQQWSPSRGSQPIILHPSSYPPRSTQTLANSQIFAKLFDIVGQTLITQRLAISNLQFFHRCSLKSFVNKRLVDMRTMSIPQLHVAYSAILFYIFAAEQFIYLKCFIQMYYSKLAR